MEREQKGETRGEERKRLRQEKKLILGTRGSRDRGKTSK